MDPRNLSPRVPDFEPIRAVETPDPYTVRVIYKELFQPGFESWGMGILPEHLLNGEALAAEARVPGKDPAAFSVRDSPLTLRPRPEPAARRQRPVPVRGVGQCRRDPVAPRRRVLGGATELPGVPDPDPAGCLDVGARLLRRHLGRLYGASAPGGAAPERSPLP